MGINNRSNNNIMNETFHSRSHNGEIDRYESTDHVNPGMYRFKSLFKEDTLPILEMENDATPNKVELLLVEDEDISTANQEGL
jgi:hypothetical protein